MTTELLDVANIRFTQEHIYDSFNANCAKAVDNAGASTVALIEQILRSEKTPLDLPLIRVAAKHGAYWSVDNRRLFVYKHCRLGRIPVQVFDWKENREFELKWKNGLATRTKAGKGQRIGILQRTKVPFPQSPVMEPSLSEVHRFLDEAAQTRHEAMIVELSRKRDEEAASAERESRSANEQALGNLLSSSTSLRLGKRKKRKRCSTPLVGEEHGEHDISGQASLSVPVEEHRAVEATSNLAKTPKRKVKTRRLQAEQVAEVSLQQKISSNGTTLTVTMEEDSDNEAFEVQLFAPA